jgi:hypothetical protein
VATWAATGKTIVDYCEAQKQMLDKCDKSDYSVVIAAATGGSLVKYCQAQKKMLDNCDKSGFSPSYAAAQAASGGPGTTLVKYCEAQKKMLDNCDKSDYSVVIAAATGGPSLVEYCYNQKVVLANYCKDVVLNVADTVQGTTLWKKCKKTLEGQVAVNYGKDWSGNEFHDGDKLNIILPPYGGDDIYNALKYGVNLEDKVKLYFEIKSSPLGIKSLECTLDGTILLNDLCGSNFSLPKDNSGGSIQFQTLIDPGESIGKHSFQISMKDMHNHEFQSNIFRWEMVEVGFL